MVPQITKGVTEEGVSLHQSHSGSWLASSLFCDLRALWYCKEWVGAEVELEDISIFEKTWL